MKKYILSIQIVILSTLWILSSCTIKTNDTTVEISTFDIELKEITDAITNDIVDSVYYVGLPHIDGNIPVNIDKIYIIDGLIYIADCRHGKIFAYEENSGNPKFIIDRRGAGPQDYAEIRSMAADEKQILIIDNVTHKLQLFDSKTGEHIATKKLPVVADDIEILEDDNFIFATSHINGSKLNIEQPKCRLFVTDNDLNIVDRMYQLSEKEYDSVDQRNIFSRCEKGIIFSSSSFDGFVIIDTSDPKQQTLIKLPFDKGLDSGDPVDIDNLSKYQYLITAPYMSRGNLYLQYSTGDGQVRQNIWSKQHNGLLSNSPDDLSKAILPVIGSTPDCLISMVDCHETYSAITGDGFTKAPDNVEQILKNDSGIALVFYKMK